MSQLDAGPLRPLPEELPRVSGVRFCNYRFDKLFFRLGKLIGAQQYVAPIAIGRIAIRIYGDCLRIVLARKIDFANPEIRVADEQRSLVERRLQLERTLIVLDGALEVSFCKGSLPCEHGLLRL